MGVILIISSDKGLISKAYNDLHRLTKEKIQLTNGQIN
jgi:hypothetical protein